MNSCPSRGVGRYTAGAIRSFAFNEDAPILDTNVIRVLHRVFIAEGDPKAQKIVALGTFRSADSSRQGWISIRPLWFLAPPICGSQSIACSVP